MLVRFVCWLLKNRKISTEERQRLTTEILSKIDALPTHAIITVVEGKTFIRGIELDGERATMLRENAVSALHNKALEAVHEEVLYRAVALGVHQGHTTEQIQFSKAAIWYGQEEVKILKALASGESTELLG